MSDAPHIAIRPFRPDDVAALVDVYNQARPIEIATLSEERFWAWFADPSLDPERDILVAEDDKGLVGMIAAFPWPNHLDEGYVFFVGPSVLPEFQHHGLGRRLAAVLFERLAKRHPGCKLHTRLGHEGPAAHAFLARHGFTVDRRFWLMTHPAPGDVVPGAPPDGIVFTTLSPGFDAAEVVEVYRQILDDPLSSTHVLSDDELRGWAALRHFASDSFRVALQKGKIVGLCFTAFPPGMAHAQILFLGVLREMRGLGVATHMLQLALASAHARGRKSMKLEVEGRGDDDRQATLVQDLYRRMGFEQTSGEVFYQRDPAPAQEATAPASGAVSEG